MATMNAADAAQKLPVRATPRAVDARTDEQLMAAYQTGEPAAFRLLVERHHAPVYRFCLRALRSPEAAADAAQEVFLRVVKNAAQWEPKAKFTTWVYTIARNHCIDEVRKGRFRKTESLNEPLHAGLEEGGAEKIDNVPSTVPLGDDVAHGTRIRKAIDTALATLPDEQREVFLLREISGLAFKDIADSVGVGENT
ncbi:MAG TPA: sigma-70 family RNA polymerase sigma factor, partial [Myxococcota bacterium]